MLENAADTADNCACRSLYESYARLISGAFSQELTRNHRAHPVVERVEHLVRNFLAVKRPKALRHRLYRPRHHRRAFGIPLLVLFGQLMNRNRVEEIVIRWEVMSEVRVRRSENKSRKQARSGTINEYLGEDTKANTICKTTCRKRWTCFCGLEGDNG